MSHTAFSRVTRIGRADPHRRRTSRKTSYICIRWNRCGEVRNAIAIAGQERGGEVRYFPEVYASPDSMRGLSSVLPISSGTPIFVMRLDQPVMALVA